MTFDDNIDPDFEESMEIEPLEVFEEKLKELAEPIDIDLSAIEIKDSPADEDLVISVREYIADYGDSGDDHQKLIENILRIYDKKGSIMPRQKNMLIEYLSSTA